MISAPRGIFTLLLGPTSTILSFAIKTAPKLTIQGGTTEVLRGIIARGLGLR